MSFFIPIYPGNNVTVTTQQRNNTIELRADFLIRFKPNEDKALTDAPISVVLPKDLDAYVRGLLNRSAWLRDTVAQKRAKELHPSLTLPMPDP